MKPSLRIVVSDGRDHLPPPRSHTRSRSGETHSRVIEVGRVWLVGRDHSLLIDQPATWIKSVSDAALENPQLQPLEQHLNTVPNAAGLGAHRPECALEA